MLRLHTVACRGGKHNRWHVPKHGKETGGGLTCWPRWCQGMHSVDVAALNAVLVHPTRCKCGHGCKDKSYVEDVVSPFVSVQQTCS